MAERAWRKSSYSSGVNSMCTEVARDATGFLVQDSKAPGEFLHLEPAQWRQLVAAIRGGGLRG